MNHIFVYGTLVNNEVLRILIRRNLTKSYARLHGYQRVKVIGETYPAIRPEKNSRVEGILISGLNHRDLIRLDHYEGAYYERKPVVVFTSKNVEQNCETYVFKPNYYRRLTSEPWSNRYFRDKHMRQFLKELVLEY